MKFLLVTDLDNTLIGDAAATLALNQQLRPYRHKISLIYATGRSLASVEDLYRCFEQETAHSLLAPDYLITGVGSEIYHHRIRDAHWERHISLGWQREPIATIAGSFAELSLQANSEQNPWKLSYFLRSSDPARVIESLSKRLFQANLTAQIILSSNRDLDILPSYSGKGNAVTYLRQKLDIKPEATLVCGDSGNDITMFQQETLGVIVNNAQPELLDWYQRYQTPRSYLAKSSHAAGIREALFHFGLLS